MQTQQLSVRHPTISAASGCTRPQETHFSGTSPTHNGSDACELPLVLKTRAASAGRSRIDAFTDRKENRTKAGWVARTRPLAEPLSPRGPQPVVQMYGEAAGCSMGQESHRTGYGGRGT